MKILHIARWCSARVYKQVIAQQGAGWSVSLMAGQSPHVDLHSLVERQVGWCSPSVMRDVASTYDCVVVHTTIDTYNDAFELGHLLDGSTRLVWDCHDYICAVDKTYYDAVTCPSAGMAKHFGEKGRVVYSKVPESLWPTDDSLREGIVFQGTMGNGEAWSDYSGLEKRLNDAVYFYPSADVIEGYERCRIMKRLPYIQLLKALTMYEYGYAGAANKSVSIHDCVTNKFWEYKAAGLEVITWRSDEMTELNESDLLYQPATMESELTKMEEAYNG